MKNRALSTEEKERIKLLSANGNSYYAISQELNRSPHTIKKYLSEPEIINEVAVKKAELADMFESMARKMVESITDEHIGKINAYQRIVSSGICTDKMRLLRERSTQNIASLIVLVTEIDKKDREAMQINEIHNK